ncbi:hypothetical protein FIBSPDRAFT_829621 [Athelia psychrophila]|uniref:Uncharacterized protein n=1 Tax=Athelia psychrophila TaxID=1759441 RepID=A0A166GS75_9AGAM|nr:hypothetical protein FIBSPDRAFT_829621 [Fibularhizoctonia sp. CBS 109695]
MGGLYYFDGDEPHHPASRLEVATMIRKESFKAPNILAIKGRGKRDAFSKTVTILQTLWFVMQCIARAIQHLPITNLEIATLAYTTISVAMYRFWLNKPVNVSLPIKLENIVERKLQPKDSQWFIARTILFTAGGIQDDAVDVSQLRQVPTLYSGKPTGKQVILADIIALAVGAIFGAVHCIAWSFVFPSQAEKLLWRISAVTTVAVPPFCVAVYVFQAILNYLIRMLLGVSVILTYFGILLYLVARAILLVLTFTTLRDLPPAAYETIHWMSFIPHV